LAEVRFVWRWGDHGHFHFNAPQLVGEPMLAALQEPEERRARAILLAVPHGFSHVPSNLRAAITWLLAHWS